MMGMGSLSTGLKILFKFGLFQLLCHLLSIQGGGYHLSHKGFKISFRRHSQPDLLLPRFLAEPQEVIFLATIVASARLCSDQWASVHVGEYQLFYLSESPMELV